MENNLTPTIVWSGQAPASELDGRESEREANEGAAGGREGAEHAERRPGRPPGLDEDSGEVRGRRGRGAARDPRPARGRPAVTRSSPGAASWPGRSGGEAPMPDRAAR
eukprot:bmy_00333T0